MQLFNIRDYGILPDPGEIQTAALQRVIDLAAAGKGKLYFPAGIYRSGTLQLHSDMTIELAEGAVLMASREYADYQGNGQYNPELGEVVSFLYALDAENLTICGKGVIDCQGDAFAYMDRPRPILHANMDVSEMTAEQIADAVVEFTDPRPNQLLCFQNCKNLEIWGVTVKDAPCWTIVLNKCRNSKLHGFSVRNDQRLCNSDGIHLCGCSDIEIFDCELICGDDCVAMTGILDESAWNDGITVHECRLSSRSAAVRLGHCGGKGQEYSYQKY